MADLHTPSSGIPQRTNMGIVAGPDHDRREFLSFRIAEEEYCLDILKVQEIRGYEKVTPLAGTASFVKGVINLRGCIVPIFDLRIKLGQVPRYDASTIVIILNLGGAMIGGVVDSVSDVISLDVADIKPSPQLGHGIDTRFIEGIATCEGRMLIMVDIERFISESDVRALAAATAAAPLAA